MTQPPPPTAATKAAASRRPHFQNTATMMNISLYADYYDRIMPRIDIIIAAMRRLSRHFTSERDDY